MNHSRNAAGIPCTLPSWTARRAFVWCGPYAPLCGQVDLPTELLTRRTVYLRFTSSPHFKFLRTHWQGTYMGTIRAEGYQDSPQIRCWNGQCRFAVPNPN